MGVHFPPPPPAAISRVLARFDRDQLAGFIAVAIELLDVADGDPDVELPACCSGTLMNTAVICASQRVRNWKGRQAGRKPAFQSRT